jgi:hypothetical protein
MWHRTQEQEKEKEQEKQQEKRGGRGGAGKADVWSSTDARDEKAKAKSAETTAETTAKPVSLTAEVALEALPADVRKALEALGVEEADDVKDLEESHIEELRGSLKPVHQKKLDRFVSFYKAGGVSAGGGAVVVAEGATGGVQAGRGEAGAAADVISRAISGPAASPFCTAAQFTAVQQALILADALGPPVRASVGSMGGSHRSVSGSFLKSHPSSPSMASPNLSQIETSVSMHRAAARDTMPIGSGGGSRRRNEPIREASRRVEGSGSKKASAMAAAAADTPMGYSELAALF